MTTNLTKARFSIEGNPDYDTFDGWHDDARRWNGWAEPLFTRATVEAVAAMVNPEPSGYSLVFDGDTLVLADENWHPDVSYVERIEPEFFDGVPLWRCGFGWVWDTVEEAS